MAAEAAKVEKVKKTKADKKVNCLSCNKVVKKLRRYYRDGKYYCTKKCWREFLKKSKEEAKK